MTTLQAASARTAPARRADAAAVATAGLGENSRTDGFGRVVARHFGVPDAPALVARPAREARLGVSRLSCATTPTPRGRTIPAEDSFVVMLHLADYRHHELWSLRGRPMQPAHYPKDSIAIVNLMDDLSATVGSPLDALCFYIPRATLDQFTEEAGCGRVAHLACAPALIDRVLANIGAALLPALERPSEINALFVDRISLALQAHVAASYGGATPSVRRTGGLTGFQEARAKRYLLDTEAADLSLAGAAATCGLSRSYFSKAFKATTGRSPHRWLIEYRIQQSRQKLRGPGTIADIALECGFTDQSHFTRVFTQLVGVPPGLWRRRC